MKFSPSSLNAFLAPAAAIAVFLAGCGKSNAQDLPPEPSLAGQSFKITVIENLSYLVNVDKDDDGNPTKDQITGYMKDMIDGVAQKAGFEYELYLPSGYGPSCLPQVEDINNTEDAYAKVYRPQFK